LSSGETRRLPPGSEKLADRLLALGARGVGGFSAGGRDDEGSWLARDAAGPRLAEWLRDREPVEWRVAVAMVGSLAEALAACEEASLFPGPLDADRIEVKGDRLAIPADGLVAALFGAGHAESPPAARWIAPEQAAGAPPDSAGNRYLAGLVLYVLLAGEHPFSGRGLRLGLDDQAQRGAPPMPEVVAQSLPPGLQSFCLRMLDPDPARRPPSARAIADRLADLATAKPSEPRKHAEDPATEIGTAKPAKPDSSGFRNQEKSPLAVLAVQLLVPLIGLTVGVWAVTSTGASTRKKRAVVGERVPLSHAAEVSDCASCHPRQSAEWSRSVMAQSVESPLFQSLEMLIQEQVGRDRDCPGGAGILRAAGPGACTSRVTGLPVTGSGGELWCVNCHAPTENLRASLPAWNGLSSDSSTRRPLRDLLPRPVMEGIGCAMCHQVAGPVRPGNQAAGLYEGNPSWISPDTGARFGMRPEDRAGQFGIGNSGYLLDPRELLATGASHERAVPGGAHLRPSAGARGYLASSEFCGSCHDVRLFGTDTIGVERGEHFKRLRNAYSEWADWRDQEQAAGRAAASCQDCHMSLYPGVCLPAGEGTLGGRLFQGAPQGRGCPPGTRFEARRPGAFATGRAATGSAPARVASHYFSGVDVPLSSAFAEAAADDSTVDLSGIPLGARQRRDLLLASALRLELAGARKSGQRIEIPILVENVGAGHKVPAGFSQEREIWVHLKVTDARGRLVYEVGRVDRGDEDLRDKVFLRINTSSAPNDALGRVQGLFGADIADGPDVPDWIELGSGSLRGRGLVNFQNGFLRCVRCIGRIDGAGRCQPLPGQEGRRADRYADGDYDPDSGECRSNLRGQNALFETYFPVGALDASRGLARAPDAIIDTRALSPGRPVRYIYDLDAGGASGPLTVEARLLFRAFPPYLLRAFADYEAEQDRRGLRPSGPLLDTSTLARLDVVELAAVKQVIE
jgi:eukaryotic-like serine/threonine-protein kinase